jgi:hypothetical protein
MTVTRMGARLTSFCEMLPTNNPAMRPVPRLPTTDGIRTLLLRNIGDGLSSVTAA